MDHLSNALRAPARIGWGAACRAPVRWRASGLVLLGFLALVPPSKGGETDEPRAEGISVSCKTFLDRRNWSPAFWIPCPVEIVNLGTKPASVTVGIVHQSAGPKRPGSLRNALAVSTLSLGEGATKKFFLYVPPRTGGEIFVVWEVRGRSGSPPFPLEFLWVSRRRGWLVIGRAVESRWKIASVFGPARKCLGTGPKNLPDRPEGYDQFNTIILHELDPAVLPLPVRRALCDWTLRGGRLVLSPGEGAGLFQDPVLGEIHPFRAARTLPPRKVGAFGALKKEPTPPTQNVHVLEGGDVLLLDRQGLPMVLTAKAGLGCVVALATTLEVARHMTPGGVAWFAKNVIERGKAPTVPGRPGRRRPRSIAGFDPADEKETLEAGTGLMKGKLAERLHGPDPPAFRNFLFLELPYGLSPGTRFNYKTFLLSMVKDVAGTPGIGFVTFFLLVFVAVGGPVNYWFLRKKKAPALSALTVPFISVAFVLLVVIVGLLTKGGTLGNRLVVLETRSGQPFGVATGLTYFRTGAGGEYSFTAGEGIFPLPEIAGRNPFRLEQSGTDRLVLPLDRWVVSGFQTETAVPLHGAVEAVWTEEGVHIVNTLPVELQGGVIVPPFKWKGGRLNRLESGTEIFTRGIVVPAKGERHVLFRPGVLDRLSDDDALLAVLCEHQRLKLGRGGFACWVAHPFEPPELNGRKLRLVSDRTVLILPLESAGAGDLGDFEPWDDDEDEDE